MRRYLEIKPIKAKQTRKVQTFLFHLQRQKLVWGTNEYIIRARSETCARKLAAKHDDKDWLDPNVTTCELLTVEGLEGIITFSEAT